jgi:hypothetical protein
LMLAAVLEKSPAEKKKKYGLNCQAVCDVCGKILDLSILYPDSNSDILTFEGSSLFQKFVNGLLALDCVYLVTRPISIRLTWQRQILQCQVVLKMPTISITSAQDPNPIYLWDFQECDSHECIS